MSQNSSSKPRLRSVRNWQFVAGVSLWTLVGFLTVEWVIVPVLIQGLVQAGVPLGSINPALFNTIAAAVIYVLSLMFVIGLPYWLRQRQTTKRDIGMTRLPSWLDLVMAPAAFFVYMISFGIIAYIVSLLIPNFNFTQTQEIGFSGLSHQYEYILAFATLVILAPLAEETLFRGYLFGKLKKHAPIWLSIIITSVLFGGLHLIAGEQLQWNVALDTFVLSLVLCSLRLVTGNIWAGILLHMLKNGIAYYFLFINPSLLHTIGG